MSSSRRTRRAQGVGIDPRSDAEPALELWRRVLCAARDRGSAEMHELSIATAIVETCVERTEGIKRSQHRRHPVEHAFLQLLAVGLDELGRMIRDTSLCGLGHSAGSSTATPSLPRGRRRIRGRPNEDAAAPDVVVEQDVGSQ